MATSYISGTQGFKNSNRDKTTEMGKENKSPIQQSLLSFKYATKILHKYVNLELLGGFPVFLKEALVFVEFAEYITFLEDMQFKKHIIIDFLHICLIIKVQK